mmetsp:Transcript_51804/g.77324  ORF Transcript_51804/g.77324 Transcript_51804/m.77324 type:complete len:215 (-) Transcript_51804:117-761(-)
MIHVGTECQCWHHNSSATHSKEPRKVSTTQTNRPRHNNFCVNVVLVGRLSRFSLLQSPCSCGDERSDANHKDAKCLLQKLFGKMHRGICSQPGSQHSTCCNSCSRIPLDDIIEVSLTGGISQSARNASCRDCKQRSPMRLVLSYPQHSRHQRDHDEATSHSCQCSQRASNRSDAESFGSDALRSGSRCALRRKVASRSMQSSDRRQHPSLRYRA